MERKELADRKSRQNDMIYIYVPKAVKLIARSLSNLSDSIDQLDNTVEKISNEIVAILGESGSEVNRMEDEADPSCTLACEVKHCTSHIIFIERKLDELLNRVEL